MGPKQDITKAKPPRLSAEEKKRLAIEKRDARLAAGGKTVGQAIAAAHGILAGPAGDGFERAFWAARRAGMMDDASPTLD